MSDKGLNVCTVHVHSALSRTADATLVTRRQTDKNTEIQRNKNCSSTRNLSVNPAELKTVRSQNQKSPTTFFYLTILQTTAAQVHHFPCT